ncbi:MAG TPA: Gfo/Idh/MocA family oxidoreductase [Candidatus Binataceae bacterium]|nr:Gfo/Idh/MocA family oxidoreductase [Candidatus Binataceae bacterium]
MNQINSELPAPAARVNAAPARRAEGQVRGLAVVGLGYWGPNWVRNFTQLQSGARVLACDLDAGRRERIRKSYPEVQTCERLSEVLQDPEIDGVVVATPVSTHYPIARQVLQAGKAVLVEKPLAMSRRQAEELVILAREADLPLMVGHTFEYSAPVLKVRDLIARGELGEVLYISSVRANLGLLQHDVNVAWDLATHDISIILMLLGQFPHAVSCQGKSYYRGDIEDVAMLTLHFPGKILAFIHVSWLDPNKIRRTTIVGSRRMLVYDDTATQEKIRIYDKGVDVQRYYDSYDEFQLSYRYGDIQIPRIEETEPLRMECQHFIDCIATQRTPNTDGLNGLRVVSVLEAASLSLKNAGALITLANPGTR